MYSVHYYFGAISITFGIKVNYLVSIIFFEVAKHLTYNMSFVRYALNYLILCRVNLQQ